ASWSPPRGLSRAAVLSRPEYHALIVRMRSGSPASHSSSGASASRTISSLPLGRRRTRPGRPGASGMTSASREMPRASVTAKTAWISVRVTRSSTRGASTRSAAPPERGGDSARGLLQDRLEPDLRHDRVPLLVRMDRVPIWRDAEEIALVHAVEDLRQLDVLRRGETANARVDPVDDVVGAGIIPEVRRDGSDDRNRLVGLGAVHHVPEIVEGGVGVLALRGVVGALHDEDEAGAVVPKDGVYPAGALGRDLTAHPAVGHGPRRVETPEFPLEDVRVVVAGGETKVPTLEIEEAGRDAVAERGHLPGVVVAEVEIGRGLRGGGRAALAAPPAAGGGEEGDAKADVADEAGGANHDCPPEMISRTV